MNSNEIISSGILEQYVLGFTSPEENADIMRWAKQYPEVAIEIKAIQFAMEKFAQANAIEPDPSVKAKIFAKINEQNLLHQTAQTLPEMQSTPVVSMLRNWKWMAAASIIVLLVSATFNLVFFNKLTSVNDTLAITKQLLEKEQQHSNELKNDWDIVRDPNNVLVSLKGLETNPNATAKIFWFQQTGEVRIDASNLPLAPAGKQYQFWAIVDGKPVDGGLIITGESGTKYRMQKMKSFGKAEAFAISLEKAGGSTSPTVVVSIGKII